MPAPGIRTGDPDIADRLLPYAHRLESRPIEAITLAVIHCTELPDLAAAREFGEKVLYGTGTGNSGHYYIDRDGRIERWVPDDRVAHHVRGHNAASLGIELVNTGRWPDWYHSRRQHPSEPYPPVQIDALIALLLYLQRQLPNLGSVAGHEDLDRDTVPAIDAPERTVRRKLDPGPQFPWPTVLAATPLSRHADESRKPDGSRERP